MLIDHVNELQIGSKEIHTEIGVCDICHVKSLYEGVSLAKYKKCFAFSHVLMSVPLVATRNAKETQYFLSEAEAGKTERPAPQSKRKEWPDQQSQTILVFLSPWPTAKIFCCWPPISIQVDEIEVEDGMRYAK